MFLQLADNGYLSAAGKSCTCKNGFTGWCASGDCSACCGETTIRSRSLSEGVPAEELYIFVPTDQEGNGKLVREDYFDQFDDQTYDRLMVALAPFQDFGVNGFFSNIADKIRERKERRQQRKDLKAQSKATARVQRTAGGGFGGKLLDTVSGIFGGQQVDAGLNIETGQAPTGYFRTETEKPWYTNPVVIIGGVALIGTGIYFATRKK